jgi:hypothetical protein
MNKLVLMTTLTCALVCNAAWANDDKPAKPNKMATCNKEAEGKKGDERKAFMKECLSAKAPAADADAAKTKSTGSQQNKMKRCNEEAAGLKGDERKQKMSACLKG